MTRPATSQASSSWLNAWLEETRAPTERVVHTEITEQPRPDDIHDLLAKMLMEGRANLELSRRLLRRLGWASAGARMGPSKTIQKRHGDFGEVLTIGLLRELRSTSVPIVKLRYYPDAEQTLHGTDVVGFVTSEQPDGSIIIERLVFVETKVRVSNDRGVLCNAHKQLSDDAAAGFVDTLEFLHQRLETEHPHLLGPYESYLSDRSDRALGDYQICLIINTDDWRQATMDDLLDEAEIVSPLTVDVVYVNDLRILIDGSWQSVRPELLGDEIPGPRVQP
ncbi:Hachiman antiphage defense system protein HamA [Actinomycetospora soli]|uniref:Hachiman antiphage defense system protein HamA n=1 Tax=Actinomycetospora soli TaxID=2893887 RepID=UPI001E32CB11|nr:Hachiman antiphage defense system protein HamA [Actinomycetospora soli]MCD2191464.1 DUF1837 domain-containing protein [Actinomycetospora soli]